MRNIALKVAYDGSCFNGWQSQASGRTVQQTLEAALGVIHDHPVRTIAAGRTDSGVHADGQVVNFHSDGDTIPARRFAVALNANLPADLRVMVSAEVAERFHARYDAQRREYRYFLKVCDTLPPRLRRYCLALPVSVDLSKANRVAAQLVGRHDFRVFATEAEHRNTLRQIYGASFHPVADRICFSITANGFLRKMVRSILGTILQLLHTESTVAAAERRIGQLLDSRDRALAGPTAPPDGLVLHRVWYRAGASGEWPV